MAKTRQLLPQLRTTDAKMPQPKIYEEEYKFWPWGSLLSKATDVVVKNAAKSAFVIDYMCGTGFLLNKIIARRPDLSGIGCDIEKSYIDYARSAYKKVTFVRHDARTYVAPQRPDFVICTAGLHHLDPTDRRAFVKKVSHELDAGGYFLVGEEVIRDYRTESERRHGVLELFLELMHHLDGSNPSASVIQAAADMMVNDWCARGEYKTSRSDLEAMLRPLFNIVSALQIWPGDDREFGDWLFLCQRK